MDSLIDPDHRERIDGATQSFELVVGGERISVQMADFSEAKAGPKHPEKNEDIAAARGNTFIVADGSTPKQGNARSIDGLTGGRIAANVAVDAVLNNQSNGRALVDEITDQMQAFYADHIPEALTQPRATFATTLVAARLIEGETGPEVVITQVGDTAFRINGGEIYTDRRRMDELDAAHRAAEIHRLIDEEGLSEEEAVLLGRSAILESLNRQHELWNNPNDELGFAYINGHHVPDKFIRVYTFPLADVHTLELFSDGYPHPADDTTVASWEAAYRYVERVDPHRYKDFLATKSADDRTVKILKFQTQSASVVEAP